MRRSLLLLCAVSVLAPGLCARAAADIFEPIQLVSASSAQQADYAHHPAISGDGRYVAFDGSFGGLIGVWRRDRLTGAVAAVASCPRGTPPGAPCAELPSISEHGRYVSFTTTLALDPKNDINGAPDVYVRDMNDGSACAAERSEAEACAYTLASARSGSTAGLSYTYGGEPAREEARYGSIASGRSALSGDGRHLAFVTTAESDLQGEHTPKLQVAVRDLDTRATRLVSVVYDAARGGTTEEPVPVTAQGIGAAYPGGSELPGFGSPGAAFAGASISADASTVAWMGQEVGRQAPLLAGELDVAPGYTEPLWRRIADGPSAAVRRITGGGDPASPACAASGERMTVTPPTLSDPCQGPFDPTYTDGSAPAIWALGATAGDYLPRLSANGQVVAILSSAREIAAGEAFTSQPSSDVYVVDMRDGLTRVTALRRLTALAGASLGETARTGPIVDVGISPDGSQVAFTTQRTVFPLGSPAYVSAPAPEAGLVELYDADLGNDTLTRVTQGFRGEPSEPVGGTTLSPSFSADGQVLAFSSTGTNLAYGDGNAPHGDVESAFDGSDAFVVLRKSFSPTPVETYVSPAPAGPALDPAWRLAVTSRSRRDGSVLLDVLVPGAGNLGVRADSPLRVAPSSSTAWRARRRRSRSRAAGGPGVLTRTVAGAAAVVRQGGLAELSLKLAPRYSSLADRRGGLSATVSLSFTAPGHGTARQSIEVTFARTAKSARRAKRARSHPHHGSAAKGRR